MTSADLSLAAFALLNGARTAAYFPQMIRVYRDPHDAAAVSLLTWTLFAAANAATVCYALTVSDDRVIAAVFSLNTVGCLAIAVLTVLKRRPVARRPASLRDVIESLRQSWAGVDLLPKATPSGRSRDDSPSARHRDAMILQGLMS